MVALSRLFLFPVIVLPVGGCYLAHERGGDGGRTPDARVTADVRTDSAAGIRRCILPGNPSFDEPPSRVDVSGTTMIGPWGVPEGDVDILVSGGAFGVGTDGPNFIDLNGVRPGTIDQVVVPEVGETYVFAFSLSGNGGTFGLEVTATDASGRIAGTQRYEGTGPSAPTPASAWVTHEFTFVARDEMTMLVFRSLSDDPTQGPLLDHIHCPPGTSP